MALPRRGGSLMWLANTARPDTNNAVRTEARHSHNPSALHWVAVLKIIACLEGSRTCGLTLTKGQGLG